MVNITPFPSNLVLKFASSTLLRAIYIDILLQIDKTVLSKDSKFVQKCSQNKYRLKHKIENKNCITFIAPYYTHRPTTPVLPIVIWNNKSFEYDSNERLCFEFSLEFDIFCYFTFYLLTFISETLIFVHMSWNTEIVFVDRRIYADLSWWLYIPSLNPYTLRYFFFSQSMLSNFIPQNSVLNIMSLLAILLEHKGAFFVCWKIFTTLVHTFLSNGRLDTLHATGTVCVKTMSTYSPSITVYS